MAVLDALESIVRPRELVVYVGVQTPALQRIAIRDADFFGTGVATWTTDRVELYLVS